MKQMEAKELRIGNWISYYGKNYQVSNIHSDETIRFYEDETKKNTIGCYRLNPDGCKKIPLTEEWLLKFGFEKELDGFYRKNKSLMIEFIFYDSGVLCANQSICLNHIKYVNQLQNLYFALTETELEYNERK